MVRLFLALALLAGITYKSDPKVIWVDVIELNHFMPKAKHAFTQVIFWNEHLSGLNQSHLHSYGFVIIRDGDTVTHEPVRKPGNIWEFRYQNGIHWFTVRSRIFHETWTETDPEAIDRSKFWGGNSPNLFVVPSAPVADECELFPPPKG